MGRIHNLEEREQFEYWTPSKGTHAARLIRIIDLGTQKNEYKGEIFFREQVFFTWELPLELSEPDANGVQHPALISKFYTNSLNEKANLCIDIQSWLGIELASMQTFDLNSLLGESCMLSVVHKGDEKQPRARISAVMGIPKNMNVPPPVNDVYAFWLSEFDPEIWAKISDGIKNIIKRSPEYADLHRPDAESDQSRSSEPDIHEQRIKRQANEAYDALRSKPIVKARPF